MRQASARQKKTRSFSNIELPASDGYVLMSDELKGVVSLDDMYSDAASEETIVCTISVESVDGVFRMPVLALEIDAFVVSVTLVYSKAFDAFLDTEKECSVVVSRSDHVMKSFTGKHISTIMSDVADVFPTITLRFAVPAP